MDYFPWQDLPGREWELLMELSFMGFVCLMWWWNVLGVLFKERGKTLNVGGEEKHTNTQCNLVCYYLGFGLKKYICEDLCISYFPNDWSVLLLLNHEGARSIYRGKKTKTKQTHSALLQYFIVFLFITFLLLLEVYLLSIEITVPDNASFVSNLPFSAPFCLTLQGILHFSLYCFGWLQATRTVDQ